MMHNLSDKTILIVDDFQVSIEIISRELKEKGVNIITARNGQEALRNFDGRNIDMVITDYMMPIMDGVEMTSEIRKIPQYEYTPIFLLTSVNDPQKKQKAYEANVTGWFQKPFNPNLFMNVILKILEKTPR